ncbi:hypothetical protein CDL12_19150 [Handroanthus impetiginosus]|uniref:Uncharacterized protein n=1 Tax=Handroanthus impetiginosus TaxID=429701 RepID=A0A2G9GSN7_9LAMI|nr:hypothetical protein CDL12_19150 [Handroanthus impetiginosus]
MSNQGKRATDDDEVEQLLRAAQDDMILKLNLNSHMARASASAAIDPDLDRRFQALRKPQKPTKVENSTERAPTKMDNGDSKVDEATAADDLFARFTALKNSLPSYTRNENKSNFPGDASIDQLVTEEQSDDEVEKVIKWAIDAARLDPSPPSDDEDDDDDNDNDNDDADESDGVVFARFTALKNSLPSYTRNENKSNFPGDASIDQQVTEEQSEDEVEKVIKWAIDAARLDPSPPSDDEDDDDDNDNDNDDADESDGVDSCEKGKRK